MKNNPGFIPAHGNYRELLSYQKAEIVYDFTYRFCQRFVGKLDRTHDQMIQAARSGKQKNFLLDRQIRRLERDFIKEGGLRERMTRVRLQQRNEENDQTRGSH
jgi:four helix bundle suffix protein